MKYRIYPALLLLILLQNALALDITKKGVEIYTKQEYNRGYEHVWDLSAIGSITLFERLDLRGGGAYGKLGETPEIKAFTSAFIRPFSKSSPWGVKALYIYNDLPDYDVRSHSILSLASYDFQRFRGGVSLGPNFRFTSFFGEPAIFESMISFSWYYDFINNERLRLRGVLGNYSEFFAKNSVGLGAASLWVNSEVFITSNWSMVNEIQFMQSGSEPLSTNFYGFAWRGGAKYLW